MANDPHPESSEGSQPQIQVVQSLFDQGKAFGKILAHASANLLPIILVVGFFQAAIMRHAPWH